MEQMTTDEGYYRLKKHINDLTLISAVEAIFSPYILYLARMSSNNVAGYHISWAFVETEGTASRLRQAGSEQNGKLSFAFNFGFEF